MVSVEVHLPQIWQFLREREATIVEHPRLDLREMETTLTFALQDALAGIDVVFIAPGMRAQVRAFWRRNFRSCGRLAAMGDYDFWSGDSGELWVGYSTSYSQLPTRQVGALYVVKAHDVDASMLSLPDRSVVIGTLADRTSWFYKLARERNARRISLEEALLAFPDQEKFVNRTSPSFRREMLLDDVVSRTPYCTFARTRIHIVTSKPLDLLTLRQREVAKQQYGEPLVPFDVTVLQHKYLAMKRLAVRRGKRPWFILVKYRRGGFTTTEQGLSYQAVCELPRTQVVTLADTIGKTQRIFGMVQTMYVSDPYKLARVGDSKSRLELSNGSEFFIGTAGSKAFARGDTLSRAHGSEVAYWCDGPNQNKNASDVLAGIFGAAEYGEVTLESTPNSRNFFFGLYAEAKEGLNDLTPIFLRWFDDPLNRLLPGTFNIDEVLDSLQSDEKELMEQQSLSIAQIAYRRQKQRDFGILFRQEFPEDDDSCFLVSGLCFFDTEQLIPLARATEELGERRHIPGGYEVVWRQPILGRKYCGGVDTSEGLGPPCDLNGVGIVDHETGEQVATVHGRWKPEILAQHAMRLSVKYNNALLGVERNNHGHSVLNTMSHMIPHYNGGPLYYFQQNRAGWSTDNVTRPQLLDEAALMVREHPECIKDRHFIKECGTFRLQKSGKWSADSGSHDDTIFKWGIAWRMRHVSLATPTLDVV